MFELLERQEREALTLTERGRNFLKLEAGVTAIIFGLALFSKPINGTMAAGILMTSLPAVYAFSHTSLVSKFADEDDSSNSGGNDE